MTKLRIDIWSDIACPWCYIGKRRLETALAQFAHAADVERVWRAFELDPSTPRIREGGPEPIIDHLARKYRTTPEQAQTMIQRVADNGAAEGLELRFDRVRRANTFDAHRLLHHAAATGAAGPDAQDAASEQLFRAYLTDGLDISDPAVLARVAGAAGLDPAAAAAMLATDRYADDVRTDEAVARELGVSGVPFFVFGGRLAVSGAQPADVLLGALERAWTDRVPDELLDAGPSCGPDGCA